jgi:hypothetical protein
MEHSRIIVVYVIIFSETADQYSLVIHFLHKGNAVVLDPSSKTIEMLNVHPVLPFQLDVKRKNHKSQQYGIGGEEPRQYAFNE